MCREGDESTTDKERSFIVVGVFHGNVLSWFCLIACAFFFFFAFHQIKKKEKRLSMARNNEAVANESKSESKVLRFFPVFFL